MNFKEIDWNEMWLEGRRQRDWKTKDNTTWTILWWLVGKDGAPASREP